MTKQTFVKRFEKWLNLDKRAKKDATLLVAKTMMRMYAHQEGAIKDLEKCRINPDFKSMFRDDLEFFIPQLCSFYLKGNLESSSDEEDLFKVIILASQTNFFFSHRIWFFFHSAMFKEFNQKIYGQSHQILKGLKTVCLDNEEEKMYIANSQSISRMIVELFMSDFYPGLHSDQRLMQNFYQHMKMDEEEKRMNKEKQYVRMVAVQKIIRAYKKHDEAVRIRKEQNLNNEQSQDGLEELDETDAAVDSILKRKTVLNAADIIINPFTYPLHH